MSNSPINSSISYEEDDSDSDGATAEEQKVLCPLVLNLSFTPDEFQNQSAKYSLYDLMLQRNSEKNLLASDEIRMITLAMTAYMAIEDVNDRNGHLVSELNSWSKSSGVFIPYLYPMVDNGMDNTFTSTMINIHQHNTSKDEYHFFPGFEGTFDPTLDPCANVGWLHHERYHLITSLGLILRPFVLIEDTLDNLEGIHNWSDSYQYFASNTPNIIGVAQSIVDYFVVQEQVFVAVLYNADAHSSLSLARAISDVSSNLDINVMSFYYNSDVYNSLEHAMKAVQRTYFATILVLDDETLDNIDRILSLGIKLGLIGPDYSWLIYDQKLVNTNVTALKFESSDTLALAANGIGIFSLHMDINGLYNSLRERADSLLDKVRDVMCIQDHPSFSDRLCGMETNDILDTLTYESSFSYASMYDSIVSIAIAQDHVVSQPNSSLIDHILSVDFAGTTGMVTFDKSVRARTLGSFSYQMLNVQRQLESLDLDGNNIFDLVTTSITSDSKWVRIEDFLFYNRSPALPSGRVIHENMNFVSRTFRSVAIYIAVVGIFMSLRYCVLTWRMRNHPRIQQIKPSFLYLVCLSLVMHFLGITLQVLDDNIVSIDMLNNGLCGARYLFMWISLLLIHSIYISKNISIQKELNSSHQTNFAWLSSLIIVLPLIVFIITWMIDEPLTWYRVPLVSDEYGYTLESTGRCYYSELDSQLSQGKSKYTNAVVIVLFVVMLTSLYYAKVTKRLIKDLSLEKSVVALDNQRICTAIIVDIVSVLVVTLLVLGGHIVVESLKSMIRTAALCTSGMFALISIVRRTLSLADEVHEEDALDGLSNIVVVS